MKKEKNKYAVGFGQLGGQALLRKYGKKYFTELIKKRWKKTKKIA